MDAVWSQPGAQRVLSRDRLVSSGQLGRALQKRSDGPRELCGKRKRKEPKKELRRQ